MKNAFAILLILSFTTLYGQKKQLNLIPLPVELNQTSGVFRLSGSSNVSYDSPGCIKIAEMLSARLSLATGFSVKSRQGNNGTIQLTINKTADNILGKEGYTLSVSPSGVLISANQPAGLFYGVQTLLQLFPKEVESNSVVKTVWTIPGVKITDYPRFGWRGLMLDVSRHFFTKEEVMKYIDQMARFKFNVLHLHLTDDNGWRVEIKSLPRLTDVGAWRVARGGHFGDREAPRPDEPATEGGYYTGNDIKELVNYAQERYITIVPEIEMPGHSMAAVASYPELSCSKDPETKVNPGSAFSQWYGNGTFKMFIDNTLNPSDEKVYEFLDKVFTEVAEMFPSPYIHVGGDECYKGYWLADEGCLALMKKLKIRHAEDLQGYFMNRVEQILRSKGKKILGWDEILEGGLSPDATVMSWRNVKSGVEASLLGHDVVMSPVEFAYLDYQQGEQTIEPVIYAGLRLKKCYSFNPVPDGADSKFFLGGQGNLWTEQIATLRHAEYMTWPRGWALAEDFWSPDTRKNWTDFVHRVESQFERSEIAGVNYSKAIYDPVITTHMKDGKMILEMETEAPDLDIYYTVDDAMPDKLTLKYDGPFELPEGGPVTLRVVTYRNGKPAGHLLILKPEELKSR
jgi:hexosaminidase